MKHYILETLRDRRFVRLVLPVRRSVVHRFVVLFLGTKIACLHHVYGAASGPCHVHQWEVILSYPVVHNIGHVDQTILTDRLLAM